MVSKDKSLTNSKGIFIKIINFFKKLFKKDKIEEEVIPNIEVENISVSKDIIEKEQETSNEIILTPDMFDEEGMPKPEYSDIIFEKVKQELEKKYNNKKEVIHKTEEEKTEEARRFFELYNKVKNGEINPEDVDSIDLIKINRMLNEEIKIHKEKL